MQTAVNTKTHRAKMVKSAWDPWWLLVSSLGKAAVFLCRAGHWERGHSHCVADIGSSRFSSLFLACLYASLSCLFLDGVKPKWVLNVMS